MERTNEPRRYFLFNYDWQEVLMDYPAEVRLEVYDAIIAYAASGKLSDMKPLAGMAFSFIRKEVDRNRQIYEERCEAIRKARSKAGKMHRGNQYSIKYNSPEMEQMEQMEQMEHDNDSVSDSDKRKEPSTVVDGKKSPSPLPEWISKEVEELKGEAVWLDQLQTLHGLPKSVLVERLDAFGLHVAADGRKPHDDLGDAKRHFNNWLRITESEKRKENGKANGNGKSPKQAANEYAFRRFAERLESHGNGVPGEVPEPF